MQGPCPSSTLVPTLFMSTGVCRVGWAGGRGGGEACWRATHGDPPTRLSHHGCPGMHAPKKTDKPPHLNPTTSTNPPHTHRTTHTQSQHVCGGCHHLLAHRRAHVPPGQSLPPPTHPPTHTQHASIHPFLPPSYPHSHTPPTTTKTVHEQGCRCPSRGAQGKQRPHPPLPTHPPTPPLHHSTSIEPPRSPLPNPPTHPPTHPLIQTTKQEPLRTKTMAKEKIYFKRLPWSPKMIGQPVGPLKGKWVGGWVGGWMNG